MLYFCIAWQRDRAVFITFYYSEQAKNNPIENFKFGFDDIFMDALISRMEQNQDIFGKMMDDKEFGGLVKGYMLKKVYDRLSA